jgi:hypothetical protein
MDLIFTAHQFAGYIIFPAVRIYATRIWACAILVNDRNLVVACYMVNDNLLYSLCFYLPHVLDIVKVKLCQI